MSLAKPVTGSIRVIHIRTPSEDTFGEHVIRVDRSHPVLGNPHVLRDKLDHEERARVIAAYCHELEIDFTVNGPMCNAVVDIARKVIYGNDIALACHCAPLPCHGDVIAKKVRRLVATRTTYRFHRDGTQPQQGEVLVFGSNLAGRHGAGAAQLARERFGAQRGIGIGPAGLSYAIPTKDSNLNVLPLTEIRRYVADFLVFARLSPKTRYFITRVGCGLAGYQDYEIAPLFRGAPENCDLPETWWPWTSLPKADSPIYAGIGSRQTPPEAREVMRRIAERLADRGYVLRSGGAEGADQAFESGAGTKKEIYLPWRAFNNHPSPLFAPTPEAMAVAASVHPAWARLDNNVQLLMGRNSHQVLGWDMETPVDFVICWTQDGAETAMERTIRTGGTGQAIALASRRGIPVFNLNRPNTLDRIKSRLDALTPPLVSIPPSLKEAVEEIIDLFPGAHVISSRNVNGRNELSQ